MKTCLRFLPALLFAAVSFLDLLLQQESRSGLQAVFANPFLDGCGLVLKALMLGCFWGAPAFLAGRWARIAYLPFWVWVCFVETVEVFARVYYRMTLDGDWLMLAVTSSAAEMRELLAGFGLGACALGVVGFVGSAALGGWAIWRTSAVPLTRRGICCGLALMAPFLVWNVCLHAPVAAFNDTMYTFLPLDTIWHARVYADVGRTAVSPQFPSGLRCTVDATERPLGLFVIGESATRAHWHLYGYERPTTPFLDGLRDELVVFRDVSATHSFTSQSLRMLLTEATLEAPDTACSTFPQQLAVAGLHSRLISAQSRWGRWEGPETLLFSGCEGKTYLAEQPRQEPPEEGPFDGELLPLVNAVLAETNAPDVVFLHLMGSHAPPFYRYPQRRTVYPRYTGDVPTGIDESDARSCSRIDTYDNSIVYTDGVLGDLVARLKARKGPSFLLYLSDHGETPDGPVWRDMSRPELYQVPFVIWFSPAYRAAHPGIVDEVRRMAACPLRLDHALPLLRRLMGVETG